MRTLITSIAILIGIVAHCQDTVCYASKKTNLTIKLIGDSTILLGNTKQKGECCKGIYVDSSRFIVIDYNLFEIKLQSIDQDSCQGFKLKGDLIGGYTMINNTPVNSPNLEFIPYDFNSELTVFSNKHIRFNYKIETPEIGCYELSVNLTNCSDFYTPQFRLIKVKNKRKLIINGIKYKRSSS